MRRRTQLLAACVVVAALCSMPVIADEAPGQNKLASTPTRCQVGPGVGATLLFPYFEVDLDDPSGATTVISVNNAPSTPTLARLIVWTDWGIPTLAFDIYLGGLDIVTINVRSLFTGDLPVTGIGADLSGFESCDLNPPQYPTPALTPGQRLQLATAHTGQAGHIDGLCYSANHSDDVARGYITVDVVDQCTGLETHELFYTPANACCSYFVDGGDPSGVALAQNRLWGDIFYIDPSNNAAQGGEAVSIWADPTVFSGTGTYTFYGRFRGYDNRDDRVPLPGTWDQRFLNGGAFDGGADVIVFHQPNSSEASPVTCGSWPAWYPLTSNIATVDEDGHGMTHYDTSLVGYVTQRISIDALSPPYDFGWLHLGDNGYQMWVQPILTSAGRYSVGLNGTPTLTLCGISPPTP